MRSGRALTLYLVTPPGLARALRLADELEEQGWRVVIADSPARGADAGAAGTCVIMLTRDGWRDPAIVAAIRNRPAVLVPVLVEPMSLPQGPWSSDPIEMRQSLSVVAERVADAVNGLDRPTSRNSRPRPATVDDGMPYRVTPASRPRRYGDEDTFHSATNSRPRGDSLARTGPPSRPRDSLNGSASRSATTSRQKARKKKSSSPWPGILAFIIVLAALGGGYRYAQQHPSVLKKLGISSLPGIHPVSGSTTASNGAYNATVPGASCDRGNAKWSQTTLSNYTFLCQSGGLLLTQTGSFNQQSGLFYNGTTGALPQNYQVKINAAIQSSEPTNTVAIAVHLGALTNGNLTSGQIIGVHADGQWAIQRINNDGSASTPLAAGVLSQPAKSFVMAVDVAGPVLTFSINGTQIGTATDTTYSSTVAVGLIFTNNGGSAAASVLLSQFAFAPLPTPAISTMNAVATATAQVAAQVQTPYTAAVPGPGCDKGAGQWLSPTMLGLNGSVTCGASAMNLQVVTKASSTQGDVAFAGYIGQTGFLPQYYKVAVTIDASNLGNGCAFVATVGGSSGSYDYVICGDGSWEFDLVSPTAKKQLLTGYVPQATSYVVGTSDTATGHVFTINGRSTPTISNTALTVTNYIGLGVIGVPGVTIAAAFSAFTVTPQA